MCVCVFLCMFAPLCARDFFCLFSCMRCSSFLHWKYHCLRVSVCLCVSVSVCLCVCVSACLRVCVSVSMSVSLSVPFHIPASFYKVA